MTEFVGITPENIMNMPLRVIGYWYDRASDRLKKKADRMKSAGRRRSS